MTAKRPRYKKAIKAALVLLMTSVVFMMGTLLWPGWRLAPFKGLLTGAMEGAVPGLSCRIESGRIQYEWGSGLVLEIAGVELGEVAGPETMRLGRAHLRFPAGRVMRGRVLPERVSVEELEVWCTLDDAGRVQLPPWLVGLMRTKEGTEKAVEGEPAELRLASIPGFFELKEGERLRVSMERYRAHLMTEGKEHVFALPNLYIEMSGGTRGPEVRWWSEGYAWEETELLRGSMRVDVGNEHITWDNSFHLPLKPDLAAWLRAGFPFWPIPAFLDTGIHFSSTGEIRLEESFMVTEGRFVLDGGRVDLAGGEPLSLGIPEVESRYTGKVNWSGEAPDIETSVSVGLGSGGGIAEVSAEASLQGGSGDLRVTNAGNLRQIEGLLAHLPETFRPVALSGDLNWSMQMDLRLGETTKVREGRLAIGSAGVSIVMEDERIQPIRIEPFRFSGTAERSGRRIQVDPFTFTVGPVELRGSELRWEAGPTSTGGEGWVALAPLAVEDVLRRLPANLLAAIPAETRAWLDSIHIGKARLDISVDGDAPDQPLGLLRLRPSWVVEIGGSAITGNGEAEVALATGEVEANASVAPFNPVGMLPPGVADWMVFDGIVSGKAWLAGGMETVQTSLSIDIGEGWLRAGEQLSGHLGKPLRVGGGHVHLKARDHERFEAELDTALSLLGADLGLGAEVTTRALRDWEGDRVDVALKGKIGDMAANRFFDVLSEELITDSTLSGEELTDLGIRFLAGRLRLAIETVEGSPFIALDSTEVDLSIQTGSTSLDFTAEGEPQEGRFGIDWAVREWDPGETGMVLGARLPVELASLRLPITAGGRIEAPERIPLAGENLAEPDLSARAQVALEGGTLGPNAHLALGLELDLKMTGDGLWTDDGPSGRLVGTVRGFDTAWIPAALPSNLLPETARPYLEGLRMAGGIDEGRFELRIGKGAPDLPVPYLDSLSYGIKGSGIRVSSNKAPELRIAGYELIGTLDKARFSCTGAGVDGFMVTSLSAEVKDPLRTIPEIRMELAYLCEPGKLEPLPYLIGVGDSVPEWLEWSAVDGRMDGELRIAGRLRSEPAPGHWRVDHSLKLTGLKAPLPPDTASFGQLDGVLATTWVENRLEAEWKLLPQGLFVRDTLSGSPVLTGSAYGWADGRLSFDCELDLTEVATNSAHLSRNKQAGEHARAIVSGKADVGSGGKGPLQARVEVDVADFLISEFSIEMAAALTSLDSPNIEDLESARLAVAWAGHSDLSLAVASLPSGVLDMRISGERLNFAPLLTLLEPAMVGLFGEATETEADGDVPPAPLMERQPEPLPAPMELPEIALHVDIGEITFGAFGRLGPLVVEGALADKWIKNLSVDFATGGDPFKLRLRPDPTRRLRMECHWRNLGGWMEAGMSPLRLLTGERAQAHPTIRKLIGLPGYFRSGDLALTGYLGQHPSLAVELDSFKLDDLALQAEIPFLSKIAALVKRKVVIQVPFKTFAMESLVTDLQDLAIKELRLEGPVTIDFERIAYNLGSGDTEVVGKIFGIGFEVVGTVPDLSFYLQEDNTLIQSVTTSDDFEW